MVTGINTFKEYFAGYENQYVLIGGAACDIIFSNNKGQSFFSWDCHHVMY